MNIPESADRPQSIQWSKFVPLIVAGGSVYLLPYLQMFYRTTMLDVWEINNTQLGNLLSIFGITALICYVPGGWLANRIAPRTLLSVSCLLTGLTGMYYATIPPYQTVVYLHVFWGITTILTFWAALIRATRSCGTADDQGKLFGMLEGGTGLVESITLVVGLIFITTVFSASETDSTQRLSTIIFTIASFSSVAGLAVWWFFPPQPNKSDTITNLKVSDVMTALKMPVVWLLAAVIFCGYTAFYASTALATFGMETTGMDPMQESSLNTLRNWMRPTGAILVGFLADRIGITRATVMSFSIAILGILLTIFMPHGTSFWWIVWLDTVIISLAVFSLRGLFYALMEPGAVPLTLTATVTGIVSLIGYTPDILIPQLTGFLFDQYPGAQGHIYYYWIVLTLCLVGIVCTLFIHWIGANKKNALNSPVRKEN